MSNQNHDVIYYPWEVILKAVSEFGTPFFLYEEKRIRENCKRFKDAFEKYFPDFQALYAIKANPNPDVMRIIMDEGFSMDASSEAEVWLLSKLGVAERFGGVAGMFTGNYTPAETLKYAAERNFILNLDDVSMVKFFNNEADGGTNDRLRVPETLSFRINPGMGKATMQNNVFAGPDAKYGVPFEKAPETYRLAKEAGVKHFGIHMMTGSNVPIAEKNYFAGIVKKLFEVVANVRDETGIEIEFMNIGGGFGMPYRPEEESLNLNDIAKSVKEVFDEQCKKLNLRAPRLMAEPGRLIVADAGWLVGKVVVIKDSYKKFVGIDASTNDMPRPAFYDAYHHISVVKNSGGGGNKDGSVEIVSIVGSICENNDQFGKDRNLPVCEIGDIVVIHNCGGHARAMAHNYNGKLRHAEYLLRSGGEIIKVRDCETIEDLFKGTNL